MDAATRAAVRARAGNCCEYCQRLQSISPLIPMQIEHIVARKHNGSNDLDNLALACAECNLHKGSDLTGLDPDTGAVTVLFNPRRDLWSDHFVWSGLHIVRISGRPNDGSFAANEFTSSIAGPQGNGPGMMGSSERPAKRNLSPLGKPS